MKKLSGKKIIPWNWKENIPKQKKQKLLNLLKNKNLSLTQVKKLAGVHINTVSRYNEGYGIRSKKEIKDIAMQRRLKGLKEWAEKNKEKRKKMFETFYNIGMDIKETAKETGMRKETISKSFNEFNISKKHLFNRYKKFEEEKELVRKNINRRIFTKKEKKILEMRYLKEMTFEEIGKLFGTTRQAAQDTAKRAMKRVYELGKKK